jgi:hypothetical protein
MLEGPFSHDKEFIRFCNENVVHFVYLQGLKKDRVDVKVDGETEARSRYVPGLTPAEIDEVGKDMMNQLRHPDAIQDWRCPRFEIWSPDQKLLHAFGPGSRAIPNRQIQAAILDAQRTLGRGVGYALFRKVRGFLDEADRAIAGGRWAEAGKKLDAAAGLKGLTAAIEDEIAERRTRLQAAREASGSPARDR